MSNIALIHGGGHRGAHWDLVRPILERHGHQVVTPDLPMSRIGAGVEAWAEVALKSFEKFETDDEPILVGHSLAGLGLPLIATRIPVRRMVFLCANVPVPNMAWNDYLVEHPDAVTVPWDRVTFAEDGRIEVPWELALEMYYPDCELEQAKRAYSLVEPTSPTASSEVCPLEVWPEVPSTYVLCREDRVIGPSWSRWVSAELFGAPAIELDGGHSPMLSRPEELAAILESIAQDGQADSPDAD